MKKLFAFLFCLSVIFCNAQTRTVTTSGGTSGTYFKFTGSSTAGNALLKDSSGIVTFGSATGLMRRFQFIDGNQGSAKVLTSDANGNATWQTGGSLTGATGQLAVASGTNTFAGNSGLTYTSPVFKINPTLLGTQIGNLQVGAAKIVQGDLYSHIGSGHTYSPTYTEYMLRNTDGVPLAVRGAVGMLNFNEVNISMNMKYDSVAGLVEHRYYDSTAAATWGQITNDGTILFGIQYVPANNANNTDIWTANGAHPFYVNTYKQPATGHAIEGFSKTITAVLQLTDVVNTYSTTATPMTLRDSNNVLYVNNSVIPTTAATWTDYGATSTVTGWTSTTVKDIYYYTVGKVLHIIWNISGTSNATSVSFTFPYTAIVSGGGGAVACVFARNSDNGGTSVAGLVQVSSNTNTVNIYPLASGGSWTNSGTKYTQGEITIPIQ